MDDLEYTPLPFHESNVILMKIQHKQKAPHIIKIPKLLEDKSIFLCVPEKICNFIQIEDPGLEYISLKASYLNL